MQPFKYVKASNQNDAIAAVMADPSAARYLAGGTTLVDLMKLYVERPATLVDINRLEPAAAAIEPLPTGGLRLGANARNTDVAYHERVVADYPVLSQAILAGATAQIRNMATVGGNLLQRVRCPYFRDGVSACNKRQPGSGCDMREGFNRTAAILGTSDACVAAHPSDMAVALVTLDAEVTFASRQGLGKLPVAEFFLEPGTTPEREHALPPGNLITGVTLPAPAPGSKQVYVKVRDRASYEFALASVAAVVWMNGDTIERARFTLGGVATRPWRAKAAEEMLAGAKPDAALFRKAGEAAVAGAKPLNYNAFKVELAARAVERALRELTGLA